MTAHDLLSQLRQKGVEVKTSGDDRLVIDAPRGTINEGLRSALSAHKAELLQILKAEASGNKSEASRLEVPRFAPETAAVAPAAPQVGEIPSVKSSGKQAGEAEVSASTAYEIDQLQAELMRLRTDEEARRAEVDAARLSMENALRTEQDRWRKVEEETARKRAEKERQRIEVEAREQAEEEHRRQIAEQELTRTEGELIRMRAMEEARRADVDEQSRLAREAHETELAALHQTEKDHARRRAEEERRYLEAEAGKRAQEDELRRSGEMRVRAVAEEIERVRAREQARQKAAEEAQRLAEEAARRRVEEDARRQAEAEARKRAEDEARLRAEIEAQMRAEAEQRRQAEEEMRRVAEEEARRRAEEEAQRLAAEQARRVAEQEAQRRADEEARQRAEEAVRLAAQEEASRRAEAEALRQAEEESRQRAEAQVRQRAELEARIRAEIEEKIRAEDAERRQAETERRHAEHERIVAEEAARVAASRPAIVFEVERPEDDNELPSLESALDESRHESIVSGQESEVTEIAEWFEVGIEKREAPTEFDAPERSIAPFGALEDDAGEFTPVSLPENNLGFESGLPSGIMSQLASVKPAERAAAVSNLPRAGGEEAFRHISAAFDDQSVEVRSAAARAMFELQEDRAAAFTRALREATPERRRKIGSAIASSGLAGEAIRNLTGESREKTYDAFSLLFLMSKAGETQVLLRSIEENANLEVRLAVVKLLALSGQPDILPAFRRMAVRGSLPPEVRSAVMEAIYQITSQSPADAPTMA
jgi:hypothetical protein